MIKETGKRMKQLLLILALAFTGQIWAQSPVISPQVINSAGGHRQVGSSGIYITDNVGEPFTTTIEQNGIMITQGFIQPEVVSVGGFSASVRVNNVTCMDKRDGEIYIDLVKSPQAVNYEVAYHWQPSGVCSGTDCDSLTGLVAQTYTVDMIITYTNAVGSVKTETITSVIPVEGSSELCKIKIYNGITANGDGINDVLIIDNIEEFPESRIQIFNRWGAQVADIKNYNNTDNAWPEQDKLGALLPSTYFYILDLGDGSKPIKGWLELIKN
jgi:gliding motility-associated-like protein